MTSEKKKVSVIIPAHNAAGTIERAFHSVLGQDNLLEIILVDDNSDDDTGKIAQKLANEFHIARLLRHDTQLGASAARNSGIAIARGEYLAFLDADDLWLPGKLQKQIKCILTRQNVYLVSCDSLQLSPEDKVLKRAHQNRVPVEGKSAWKTLLAYNFIPTPTVLARKADVIKVGGFDTALPVAEDLDLWIRLALIGEVAIVPEVLVHYYDYPCSLMKSEGEHSEQLIMKMIERHIRNNQDRITVVERHKIIGKRNYEFGLNRFFGHDPQGSLPFFFRALVVRFRVIKSLQYIFRAVFAGSFRNY